MGYCSQTSLWWQTKLPMRAHFRNHKCRLCRLGFCIQIQYNCLTSHNKWSTSLTMTWLFQRGQTPKLYHYCKSIPKKTPMADNTFFHSYENKFTPFTTCSHAHTPFSSKKLHLALATGPEKLHLKLIFSRKMKSRFKLYQRQPRDRILRIGLSLD